MPRSKRDKERLRHRRQSMPQTDKRKHADRVLKDYHYYASVDPTFLPRMAARKKQRLHLHKISSVLQEAMNEIYGDNNV